MLPPPSVSRGRRSRRPPSADGRGRLERQVGRRGRASDGRARSRARRVRRKSWCAYRLAPRVGWNPTRRCRAPSDAAAPFEPDHAWPYSSDLPQQSFATSPLNAPSVRFTALSQIQLSPATGVKSRPQAVGLVGASGWEVTEEMSRREAPGTLVPGEFGFPVDTVIATRPGLRVSLQTSA